MTLAGRGGSDHRGPMTLPTLLPGTRNVLLVSLIAFVVYVVLARVMALPLEGWLAIAPTPGLGWAWQWATHWLVSDTGGGAFRKLVELVVIYLMGSQYEAMAGSKRLYGLVAVGVIGAALGTMATIWLTPRGPWGDAATTSALLCALAVRANGRDVMVPLLGPSSPWLFVVVFGAVALIDSLYAGFAPLFTSFAGSAAAAYAYERWGQRTPPSRGKPAPKPRAQHRFRVIEGGGGERDDEPPKYLN